MIKKILDRAFGKPRKTPESKRPYVHPEIPRWERAGRFAPHRERIRKVLEDAGYVVLGAFPEAPDEDLLYVTIHAVWDSISESSSPLPSPARSPPVD